ncbi:TIGR03086 family protein [Epidermidibacterium keratini]|uniref:TIGR03086 family protein n=1 Tax=Epidermidibacterium keratini TaxID=1891644 RepID=A0A7L4YPI0_9ACTN|nr:TIGR03086 family metal-binding protein [Epidermidibacterium keratini]QHC00467.1 TIGR03086 family protein [Epidermidibacterium keratini]
MIAQTEFDRDALELIDADVAKISDGQLALATPCEGWTVSDLLRHMAFEHELIVATVLGPSITRDDPREEFARSVDRWLVAMDRVGELVYLPRLHRDVPAARVLAVHGLDMIVHRWDLAKSVGIPVETPAALVAHALPIAESVSAPDSPLVNSAYQPRRRARSRDPLDRIVALLGRDPDWSNAL